MDLKKFIEFVCTGNRGRSPVAELIGRNYLNQLSYSLLDIRSSGTIVNTLTEGSIPLSIQRDLVDKAIERNIFKPSEIEDFRVALKLHDVSFLNQVFSRTNQYFASEEIKHRNTVLKKFGINGVVKTCPEQTIVRTNDIIILAMSYGNVSDIEKIYTGSRIKPKIFTLSNYVAGNLADQIVNAYGKGLKEYEVAVEQIMFYVPKAIDKLLNQRGDVNVYR